MALTHTDGRADRRTDRHTDVAYDNNRYLKKKYILKTNACEAYEYFFAMKECTLEIVFV